MREERQPQFAGFWIRFCAYLLDSIIVGIPVGIIVAIISFIGAGVSATTNSAGGVLGGSILAYIIEIAVFILYFGLLPSSSRQATFGKQICGLKIVDEYGDRITFGRAVGRYFAYIVSGIILYIGFFMIGWDAKKQGLHDKICRTYVVYK